MKTYTKGQLVKLKPEWADGDTEWFVVLEDRDDRVLVRDDRVLPMGDLGWTLNPTQVWRKEWIEE